MLYETYCYQVDVRFLACLYCVITKCIGGAVSRFKIHCWVFYLFCVKYKILQWTHAFVPSFCYIVAEIISLLLSVTIAKIYANIRLRYKILNYVCIYRQNLYKHLLLCHLKICVLCTRTKYTSPDMESIQSNLDYW